MKSVYPENTLLSFEKAIELGVDSLEMDLNITRDGEIALNAKISSREAREDKVCEGKVEGKGKKPRKRRSVASLHWRIG